MNRQDIGKLMLAAGMGWQGQGAQFVESQDRMQRLDRMENQQRQQRNQQLSTERKQALALDFRDIGNRLRNGQIDSAVSLLNRRMQVGSMLPEFNPEDSQALKDLILESERAMQAGDQETAQFALQQAIGLTQVVDDAAVQSGIIPARPAPNLQAIDTDQRVIDMNTGREVVPAQQGDLKLPEALTRGMQPEQVDAAQAAYQAAGGGSAGLNAVNDMVQDREEMQRRENLPDALTRIYPSATQQDLAQMIEVARSADTVEDGIKQAGELFNNVQTERKARGVQFRAIDLLGRILGNPSTKNVTGPLQGRGILGDYLTNPESANALSDIEEVANILTAENLDLMSGVLSETDIKLIASLSGGGLDRRRSDTRFQRDVQQILSKLINAQNINPEMLSQLSNDELVALRNARSVMAGS